MDHRRQTTFWSDKNNLWAYENSHHLHTWFQLQEKDARDSENEQMKDNWEGLHHAVSKPSVTRNYKNFEATQLVG